VDNSKQHQQKQIKVSIKPKIFKLQTKIKHNSRAVCGQFKATTTKTDQVSIKPKLQTNKKY